MIRLSKYFLFASLVSASLADPLPRSTSVPPLGYVSILGTFSSVYHPAYIIRSLLPSEHSPTGILPSRDLCSYDVHLPWSFCVGIRRSSLTTHLLCDIQGPPPG